MQDKEKLEWVKKKVLDAVVELSEADMWAFHLHLDAKHRRALNEALTKAMDTYDALKDVEYNSYMRGD